MTVLLECVIIYCILARILLYVILLFRLDDLFVVNLTFLHGYKTATIAYITEVIIGSCDLIATPPMSLLDDAHLSAEGVLTGNE